MENFECIQYSTHTYIVLIDIDFLLSLILFTEYVKRAKEYLRMTNFLKTE